MRHDDPGRIDASWLGELGEDRLAALLKLRPDLAKPLPKSLDELARRLNDVSSVEAALRRAELPVLQVIEVLAALGGATERAAVDRLLGAFRRGVTADLDRVIQQLVDLALVRTDPDNDRLWLISAAANLWGSPLNLGPSAASLASRFRVHELQALCSTLNVVAPPHKTELITSLVEALSDGDRIRAVVAKAPIEVQELLAKVADTGDEVIPAQPMYHSPRRGLLPTASGWAAARGLLMPEPVWSATLVMPAEVGLALRGPDYAAPFDPRPPQCSRVPADHAAVERDAAAAGGACVRLVAAVLAEASSGRLTTLRDGGVGIRELKRLAKRHAAAPDEVKFAIELAHAAGLFTPYSAEGAAPTQHYDEWLDLAPPDRLARLCEAWWRLPHTALVTAESAWQVEPRPDGGYALRLAMLRHAATPDGEAVASVDELADLIEWKRPLMAAHCGAAIRRYVRASWCEASQLGLVGTSAVSAAGRALLAGDHSGLVAALAAVGQLVDQAHLQADLTAVVAGAPSAGLTELLDATADRESTASASTWRFSPGSIRRALDAGHRPDELVSRLAAASAGPLPQTLEYLITDAARRHGVIRAREALTVLHSDDTAVLAEIVADRRLRPIAPRLLAATVLVCDTPLAQTLVALRAAGYAPVAEGADGAPLPDRSPRRRARVGGHGWRRLAP